MDLMKGNFSEHFTLKSSAIANINYILELPKTSDQVKYLYL